MNPTSSCAVCGQLETSCRVCPKVGRARRQFESESAGVDGPQLRGGIGCTAFDTRFPFCTNIHVVHTLQRSLKRRVRASRYMYGAHKLGLSHIDLAVRLTFLSHTFSQFHLVLLRQRHRRRLLQHAHVINVHRRTQHTWPQRRRNRGDALHTPVPIPLRQVLDRNRGVAARGVPPAERLHNMWWQRVHVRVEAAAGGTAATAAEACRGRATASRCRRRTRGTTPVAWRVPAWCPRCRSGTCGGRGSTACGHVEAAQAMALA